MSIRQNIVTAPPRSIRPELQFLVAKGTNTNYLVKIQELDQGIEIVADMPEQMAFTIGSEWENRLPNSTVDILGGGVVAAGLGSNATIQQLTYQVWQGTSPIEVPVTLLFDAEKSALDEVYKPMRILETMALPGSFGGILTAPGPTVLARDRGVNLTIGNTLTMNNCILTSCSTQYDTRLDKAGYPIAGQAELTFMTSYVHSKEDWLRTSNLPERMLQR